MKKTNYILHYFVTIFIFCLLISISCAPEKKLEVVKSLLENKNIKKNKSKVSIIVLGNVQDAGSPQIACKKECCVHLFEKPDTNRKVVSLGVVDRENHKKYLFDATPDIISQIKELKNCLDKNSTEIPDAIFLTHAHIGHYTGLMYLGKEAMNASNIPVYTLPKMKKFLVENAPWSQLVSKNNILLKEVKNEEKIHLSSTLQVVPLKVPHRDEFSETVGYKISGPSKKALFIPDIDKWNKWSKNIISEIKKADYAFIDATFFSGKEINNRDISQIPHPFIIESMELFKDLSSKEKRKIIFIHFNHTNPVLNSNSKESKLIVKKGFRIARIHDVFDL